MDRAKTRYIIDSPFSEPAINRDGIDKINPVEIHLKILEKDE